MEKQISNGLKTTFIIHFIIGIILGLTYLLVPETWGSLVNWPVNDPSIFRLLGAALIGISAASWFAFKTPYWESVRIVVVMEMVWTVLGTLVMLWGMIYGGLPVIGWLNTVLLAAFAVVFTYFYLQEQKQITESA
ncbi:MAG: hypothetical protein HOD92_22050 [Deltaproteobacteria bacterium]|jgi:hypothetical protein|nr:hypothetical protein [Deltaproteobacteria bacterium]